MHMSASCEPSLVAGCGVERSPSMWTTCGGGDESGSATSIDAACPPVPSLFAVVEVRRHASKTTRPKHYYYNNTETTANGEFRRL